MDVILSVEHIIGHTNSFALELEQFIWSMIL